MGKRRQRVRLAGKKLLLEPMPAKQGLECVVELSKIVHELAPYLGTLAHPSRHMRVAALLRMVSEVDELPDVLIDLVAKATGLETAVVAEQATTEELLRALAAISRINRWDMLWRAAYELRVIDEQSLGDWLWMRFERLRTRVRGVS